MVVGVSRRARSAANARQARTSSAVRRQTRPCKWVDVAENHLESYDNLKDVPADHELTAAVLAEFYQTLDLRLSMLRDARRELNSHLALDFNVFSYIDPDELRLSDLIKELLSPTGSHGQGDLFLRRFLQILKIPAPTGAVVIRREEWFEYPPGTRGSIDLLIDFGAGHFVIGLENKPRASEQPDQLHHYRTYLEYKYAGRYCLVYLNGTGKKAISLPDRDELEKERKFVELTYGCGLRDWLEACAKESRAEKIRWLLRDFREFVMTEFGEGS